MKMICFGFAGPCCRRFAWHVPLPATTAQGRYRKGLASPVHAFLAKLWYGETIAAKTWLCCQNWVQCSALHVPVKVSHKHQFRRAPLCLCLCLSIVSFACWYMWGQLTQSRDSVRCRYIATLSVFSYVQWRIASTIFAGVLPSRVPISCSQFIMIPSAFPFGHLFITFFQLPIKLIRLVYWKETLFSFIFSCLPSWAHACISAWFCAVKWCVLCVSIWQSQSIPEDNPCLKGNISSNVMRRSQFCHAIMCLCRIGVWDCVWDQKVVGWRYFTELRVLEGQLLRIPVFWLWLWNTR